MKSLHYFFCCLSSSGHNEIIPTLELKNYIPEEILDEYRKLTLSANSLPCGDSSDSIPSLTMSSILSALTVDRLIRRQDQLFRLLSRSHKDWNELIYKTLATNFGFKINATGFELLAQSLPYKVLQRHGESKMQIYALLFGQAGLLPTVIDEADNAPQDEYFNRLKEEYDFLRYKYQLTPLNPGIWKIHGP